MRNEQGDHTYRSMHENEISYQIREAIFKTYNALGPGVLESAYEAVLIHMLQMKGLNIKSQVEDFRCTTILCSLMWVIG